MALTDTVVEVVRPHVLTQLNAAAAIERVNLALLPKLDRDAPAYPFDALCSLSGAAQAIAFGVQCDPATAGQSILGAAALLTQGTHNVQALNGRAIPISLALLSVVLSGDGKDSADVSALARIHAQQAESADALKEFEAAKARGDDLSEWPAIAPFRLVGDATVEGLRRGLDKGFASQGVFSTEAAAVLSGYGFSAEQRVKTAAVLTKLFDSGHLSVARASSDRVERYGVRLSAHLMIQPSAVGDAVTNEALQNQGLWPRWLLAWPETLEPRTYKPWSPSQNPHVQDYWQRCDELLDAPVLENINNAPALDYTPQAKSQLITFFEGMEREARKGTLKSIRPFALRATEMASRIAAVLSAWGGLNVVGTEEMEGALSLTAYSLANWQTVVSGQRVDTQSSRAIELYTWLAKRPSLSIPKRDIPRLAPQALRSASTRDAAIDLLESHGFVTVLDGVVYAQGVKHE